MAAPPSFLMLTYIACLLLASTLHRAAAQGYFVYNNSYAPQLFYHDPNNVLPYRQYCQCAFDVTSLGNKAQAAVSPPIMFQFGGNNGNFEPTIDVSVTGSWDAGQFSTLSGSLLTFNYSWTGFAGYNPVARVAPGAAYLANKVTVMFAGKAAPSWQYANDVIWSPNNGNTWNQATTAAPFTPRSDMSTAVAPGTNIIVFAGGQDANGGLNQVWQSTDGYGAVWTNVYNFSNTFQQAGMTFMYDSTLWGGKNPVSTLLLYNPTDNFLYRSTNLGASFTQGWNFINNLLYPNQNARLITDADNNIYMAGGNSDGNQVLFSTDSYTWNVLNVGQFNFNITNGAIVTLFQYGCLAFRYIASQTAPTGYHRQLIEYGGYITAVQNVQTGFNCFTSSQSASITSVLGELVFPNEVYNLPAAQATNTARPVVIVHDAAQQVNARSYPDCAYDVHAIISNQTIKMWHLGGFGGYYGLSSGGYSNTFDYTATGNWNTFSTIAPTYSGVPVGGFPPSGRVASGAALLFTTQNFLWFAGKDNTSSTYSNDVYASTNYGVSFSFVTNAPFIPRSDFGTVTVPGTNAVLVIAGQYGGNNIGNTLADVWLNNDGQGAVWTLQYGNGTYSPLWSPVQDPAVVALYDGQAVVGSSGQQYSTILLNTNGNDQIFMSVSLGASWTVIGLAPWSNRNRNVMVADMQNYVYMTGGSTATSEIFWSWNKGVSWNNINLPPNAFPNAAYNRWSNIVTYQNSHDNCGALRAVQNAGSPFGVHKQLILYGGGSTIAVNANPAPSCVETLYVTVAYAELMFPQEQTSAFVNTLAVSPPTGVNIPSAAFNTPSPLLTYRSYPTCAYDVHSIPSHPTAPNQYYLGGWDINGNVLATFDLIQGNNFAGSILNYIGTTNGQQPVGRVAAGAGVLYNKNLLWFGGKISASGASYINDVWYSMNPTAAPFAIFNYSTIAPWTPRSDMACAVAPMTNCIFMTGGQGATGSATTYPVGTPSGVNNDVWMSCDGTGSVWTQQTGGAPWAPQQQAAFVAMYDSSSVSSSYSQQYSTLVIYPQYNQQIFTSTTQGVSWQLVSDAPWSSRSYARFVADAENNLYLLGCAGGEICDVWYSWNKGQPDVRGRCRADDDIDAALRVGNSRTNWQSMTQVVSYPYPTPVYLSYALTTCDFINYQPGNGPNGYHRQLVMYGGFIQIFSSGDSQTLSATGAVSSQQCACDSLNGARAVSVDLVFSGETVGSSSGSGGGGTTFSQGATAGIAVGVGVGCMLLCLLVVCMVMSVNNGKHTGSTGWKKQEVSDQTEESRMGGTELSKAP